MRIELTSIFVDDQRTALAFYTEVLGFVVRHDIPMGDFAWITVVSPDKEDGPELLLEPSVHSAAGPYRRALMVDGIPLAQFTVDDVEAECERLTGLGVRVTHPPVDLGEAIAAIFDDTCGNLIQIVSHKETTT